MRRKSSAEELRNDAVGSDELYGGMAVSKDMARFARARAAAQFLVCTRDGDGR